ncbi:MAG: hypothetical protein KAT43_03290 [Nanoarchaeota archaeon]|nr:hypothetical protein [Nanoarchaeota archaeon]
MKTLKFLTSLFALGVMFGCGNSDSVLPEPIPKVAKQLSPEEQKKKEEEERKKGIEAKIREVEKAINDKDLLACFKYSTDKKRPSFRDIEKIAEKYGRSIDQRYHPDDEWNSIPDLVFIGDFHAVYEDSSVNIVSDMTENGDVFLVEGNDCENLQFRLVDILKKELAGEREITPFEMYYGIINSGNYYVHIRGMDGPEEKFNEILKAAYAYTIATRCLRMSIPENPTEDQTRKIKLLKVILPEFKRKAEQLQYLRETDYFVPKIITAVKKKKKNQIVFACVGFLHQKNRSILRRLEENEVSYISFDIPRKEYIEKTAEMKERAMNSLSQKHENSNGEEKKRMDKTRNQIRQFSPQEFNEINYVIWNYKNTFGNLELDYTITLREKVPKRGTRISSIFGGRHYETKERKIRFQLKQKGKHPTDLKIHVDEIR